MMAQNILAALDDWLGTDSDLRKPEIGSVATTAKAAANDPVSHSPSVAVTAPGTMTFHNLAQSTQGQVRTQVRTDSTQTEQAQVANEVATEKTVTTAAVTSPVTTVPAPAQVIEWRPLADVYYRHHFACLQCIAAGQNPNLKRCPVGLPLWVAYQAAFAQKKEAQHD